MTARVLPSLVALVVTAPLLVGCGAYSSSQGSRAPSDGGGAHVAVAESGADDAYHFSDAPMTSPSAPSVAGVSEQALGGPAREARSPSPSPSPSSTAAGAASGGAASPAAEAPRARELVIYTARFVMAVFQVEQALAAVEKLAESAGGYVALQKDREIVVRIPRGRFDAAIAAMEGVGDILQRDVRAEDVTEAYVDLEIRIKNARAMQQRLTELLGRASVKEALEIEKELGRVTEQLERLEGRMKVLRDSVAFSTITVLFQPRGEQISSARVHLPFRWIHSVGLRTLLSLTEEE